jgi:D-arabinose 5-phosphate isomerase GutQ
MKKSDIDSAVARAQAVVRSEAQAVAVLAGEIDESIAPVLEILLGCTGHVLVAGAGTSAAVAERMAHLLSCCGTPALLINAADGLHGGSGAIKANDVVYIISKGGQSAEINQFADLARLRGARVIVQTEDTQAPLAQKADAVYRIKTVGDVDPFGLIATGSSLVSCAAGDALCVLLLELKGYTRDDFAHTHPGGAVGKMVA